MKPHRCPICGGTTVVTKGFYPNEPHRTKCKACLNGIVFGAERQVPVMYVMAPSYQVYPFPGYWQDDHPWRPQVWGITNGGDTTAGGTFTITSSSAKKILT